MKCRSIMMRIISILLASLILSGVIMTPAFAAEMQEHEQETLESGYPYAASSTMLISTLPMEFAQLEPQALLAALQDEAALGRLAQLRGISPFEAYTALLRENELGVQYIKFGMCEDDVSYLMADELCMFGSDALYVPGMKVTHPCSIATFPCVLRRAVREEKSISLSEAVRKLTGMPAAVYGLAGKGLIREGMYADLALFDAASITDHATYTQPLLPNEGIRRVYVGGVCAVRGDQYTGAMAGKLLRRSR